MNKITPLFITERKTLADGRIRVRECEVPLGLAITLVGSTKFKDMFEHILWELSIREHPVYTVCVYGHQTGMDMNGPHKRALDRGYLKKIANSDAIFVINPGGYIGLGACDEIHYALAMGKGIFWLEEPEGWSDYMCEYMNDVDTDTENIPREETKMDDHPLIVEEDTHLNEIAGIIDRWTSKYRGAVVGQVSFIDIKPIPHGFLINIESWGNGFARSFLHVNKQFKVQEGDFEHKLMFLLAEHISKDFVAIEGTDGVKLHTPHNPNIKNVKGLRLTDGTIVEVSLLSK